MTRRSAGLRRVALLAALLVELLAPAALAAPPLENPLTSDVPINLDAESSEFDRPSGRLVFHKVHITQGVLGIQADSGEALRLDFEDSRWVFTGHVILTNGPATTVCDSAELSFKGHRLRTATLRGDPARFEQRRDQKVTTGRANLVEYDVTGGLIRLSRNAWLSDGANEVSGDRVSYDLQKDFVLADSDAGGKVRMRINSAAVKKSRGQAP
jgi:lipopolysaccharide export system protein LptA